MKKEWFSYKEVAERLGVAAQTLRIWKMEGKIKPKKFGGAVRFHISYILEIEEKGINNAN